MKIQEVLTKTTQFFKDKKIDTARLDAEILISTALKIKRIDLYLKFDQPLREDEVTACRELVRRRSMGEPIAYILNEKGFFGLDFYVDNRVLIPRPETELLAEEAVKFLKSSEVTAPAIADFGSGSGCLGLSVLNALPVSTLTSYDISSDALEVAKMNAEKLALLDRAKFVNSKVQDAELGSESLNLIVANPPYIGKQDPEVQPSVVKFEPHMALFADEDGMQEIREWTPKAFAALKSGGALMMEIGYTQGQQTIALFEQAGFKNVVCHKDLASLDRFVVGVKE